MTRNEILSIRSLQNRNERQQASRFVVEGVKGLIELGESDMEVVRIYCVDSMVKHIPPSLSVHAEVISPKEMSRISSLKTPPGLLATVAIPNFSASAILASSASQDNLHPLPFVLVADRVADPGNLGTLIRTADWFGMRGVFLTPGSTDPWSPKCVQASMGSIFRVPVTEMQPEDSELITSQKHYALDMQGNDYTLVKWKPGLIWVGSESHGIKTETNSMQFEKVHIPSRGGAESLNAGVAGSIVCSEIARVWGLN